MHDLDDLLIGMNALDQLGADRLVGDPGHEVLDDVVIDVGLSKAFLTSPSPSRMFASVNVPLLRNRRNAEDSRFCRSSNIVGPHPASTLPARTPDYNGCKPRWQRNHDACRDDRRGRATGAPTQAGPNGGTSNLHVVYATRAARPPAALEPKEPLLHIALRLRYRGERFPLLGEGGIRAFETVVDAVVIHLAIQQRGGPVKIQF